MTHEKTPLHEERYHPKALGSRRAESWLKGAKDFLPWEFP
jgi:hypothetical protein